MESTRSRRSEGVILLVFAMVIVSLVIYIQRDVSSQQIAYELNEERAIEPDTVQHRLTQFDPNTVELRQLREMGFTKNQALSLLRYRASGKVFRIKEELIACYLMTDSLYFALEPYIVIGEEFRYKKREEYKPTTQRSSPKEARATIAPSAFLVDTVSARYLHAIGALSPRQAEIFIKWRDMSGMRDEATLRECYVVSDSIADVLLKYAIFPQPTEVKKERATPPPLIDLNHADSASLRSVKGIGEKSVAAIMNYREKLGGFYSAEQLRDLNVIMDSNYEKIITQIFVDSCDISKIDVNFALAKELSRHPYIAPKLRRLLHKRGLKGGWNSIEEMIDDKIFSREEAQQVRPYLHFEVHQGLTE